MEKNNDITIIDTLSTAQTQDTRKVKRAGKVAASTVKMKRQSVLKERKSPAIKAKTIR
jgi:hypothetical protein